MGLIIVILIAGGVMLFLWRFAGMQRDILMLTGAALALGMAGYALQGQPSLAASLPTESDEVAAQLPDLKKRQLLMGRFGGDADTLAYADAYFNAGRPDIAVMVLKRGLAKNDKNPQLWVGMGNALTAYNKSTLSPAAEYSFKCALELDPNYPGTLYFYGLALAQSGRLDDARQTWVTLLQNIPADAPQRKDMIAELVATGILTAADVASTRPLPR